MDTAITLLSTSLAANIELITLCLTGATLSHLGHWNGKISADLSNGVYKIFFPALAFGAILDTVHKSSKVGNTEDLFVPLITSVTISLITCLIAYPVTYVIGTEKDALVKRAMFMCLVLGNSNNMVLLIMQSLCDSYQPLHSPNCITKSTTYATLYILPVTVFTWTFLFPYLLHAPKENDSSPLLSSRRQSPNYSFMKSLRDSLFCPPTVTVLFATLISFLPSVPEMLLNDDGLLHPFLMSTNLVGTIAVPLTSVIVGAELYESLTEEECTIASTKTFGNRAIVVISLIRFILLPFTGRVLHQLLSLQSLLSPVLGVFVLSEWSVTSANNTIIMASIIAEAIPGRGERLRRDVAKCLFLQYLLSPILVTINTAIALKMAFE